MIDLFIPIEGFDKIDKNTFQYDAYRRRSSRRGWGRVSLSACWGTPPPQMWAWRPPPGVGLETTPQPDPSTSPLGVGLETCKACLDTTPLETCCKACWDTTCNACWDITPPVNRITDMYKNITLPKLRSRC